MIAEDKSRVYEGDTLDESLIRRSIVILHNLLYIEPTRNIEMPALRNVCNFMYVS